MGISNRQRRQTKKRRQATRDQRSASERTQPPGWSEGDSSSSRRSESSEALDEMIGIAAHWAHGPHADADSFERALNRLVAFGNMSGETRRQVETALASQLVRSVRVLWDNGWQPFDLIHVVRRQCGVRVGRLCTMTVAVKPSTSVI